MITCMHNITTAKFSLNRFRIGTDGEILAKIYNFLLTARPKQP